MTILFLASFIGGLLLAVRVMIVGVERPREENPAGERSFRLSPPVVSAFGVVFGAVGYILYRPIGVTVATAIGVAVVLGVVAAVIAAHFVRKWWAVTPEHEHEDERYTLQGHIARVTKPIRADVDGEVAYELGDKRHVLKARSFDDVALSVGTDVVIERIEDEIAYVEAWMEVEKRL
jgi:membrane protein implicated in regulation of membrane protease activity